jgi:hypothetical protein
VNVSIQRNIGEGPVWINLNWILYNGLKDYGYDDIAFRVKADSRNTTKVGS